jgi:hypothetical protein
MAMRMLLLRAHVIPKSPPNKTLDRVKLLIIPFGPRLSGVNKTRPC